jgi:uncharacterized protein YrrD
MNAIVRYSNLPQKASLIIGSDVVTPDGESLGDIRDIVLDPRTGTVSYCVVSSGGFLGLGRKLFAIPFSALGYDLAEDEYVLDVSKQHLLAASGFDATQWPLFADEQWKEKSPHASRSA